MSIDVSSDSHNQRFWRSSRWMGLCAIFACIFLIAFIATRPLPPVSDLTDDHSPPSVSAAHAEIAISSTDEIPSPPGYVGPLACIDCHRERVAEFMQTKHFQACREPEADGMPKGFLPGHGQFPSREPQIAFEMTHTKEGFFQTATVSNSSGQRKTSSRIDLIYGSPPNDEVYFTWQGDHLSELPVAWLHPQQEWGASTFHPDSTGDFSRPISVRCLECHTTWFQHVPGTLNRFNRDHFILGVTCERCHGPAQSHVDFHHAHPEQRQANSILHPGHLSRELLIDVCTQCHSNAIKHRGPAFSYRPGQPLEERYRTVGSRFPEDDHVANQIKYLRESRCFQKSESMTCVTCHNPHQASHDVPHDERQSIQSCLTCHPNEACRERPQLPSDVQNKCIECHMPAHNKIQVYFDTATDAYVAPVKAYEHRIGIDPVATKNVLREWYSQQPDEENQQIGERISKNLVQYWLGVADRRRQEYRHLAAIDAYRQALHLEENSEIQRRLKATLGEKSSIDNGLMTAARQIRLQQYADAATTLEDVLQIKPNLAQAHGKLGSVYAALGQTERAVAHLEAVKQHDPDDAYGEAMLGWLDYTNGQYHSAAEHYQLSDEIEPYKAKLHYQWGLALLKSESWSAASDHFRLALTIDPRHFQSCLGLSQALQNQGHTEDAIAFARRAVRITDRKQPEVLLHLAERLAENRQIESARQTAEEALRIARENSLDLVPRIQRRLREFQDP